jgi:Flp pilus assembly protein TadG
MEVAMAVPALLLLLMLAVAGGRTAGAQGMVDAAAGSGAQAAALADDPSQAPAAAETTVDAALQQAGADCGSSQVTVDTSHFGPGGTVTVTVTCEFSLSGISLLPLSSNQVSGTSVAPIEPYRSVASG